LSEFDWGAAIVVGVVMGIGWVVGTALAVFIVVPWLSKRL